MYRYRISKVDFVNLVCLTNKTGCHITRHPRNSAEVDILLLVDRLAARSHVSIVDVHYDSMPVSLDDCRREKLFDDVGNEIEFDWKRVTFRVDSQSDPATLCGFCEVCIEGRQSKRSRRHVA